MLRMFRILSLLCVVLSAAVSAGQVTDLYQADVAADGNTAQWQQQALLQVLVRVSGNAEISAEPAIAAELKQASGYIKQFEAVRHADGNRMRVLLDATKVNQLLQQHGIAVWGALRPDILVWLVQQDNGNRTFVRQQEQRLNTAMRQAFHQAGLPLLQPLYDMDDLLNLSETDVWAGFWQQINQASARYNTDVVVTVTVDKVLQDDSQLYRLNWQRQDNGRTYRDEVTAADEDALMQHFAATLSTQLAQQYASVMLSDGTDYILEIQQLNSLSELVQVHRLLQQVVGIADVTITRFNSGTAQYRLHSNISAEGLLNALRFNPRLRLLVNDNAGQSLSLNAAVSPVLASYQYIRP